MERSCAASWREPYTLTRSTRPHQPHERSSDEHACTVARCEPGFDRRDDRGCVCGCGVWRSRDRDRPPVRRTTERRCADPWTSHCVGDGAVLVAVHRGTGLPPQRRQTDPVHGSTSATSTNGSCTWQEESKLGPVDVIRREDYGDLELARRCIRLGVAIEPSRCSLERTRLASPPKDSNQTFRR